MQRRPPDFRAAVTFVSEALGGRQELPRQGIYRPDIRYADDDLTKAWMVWPLFLSDGGCELEGGVAIPAQCNANFYIVDEHLRREIHAPRLSVGVQIYLVGGSRLVAVCAVTALALGKNLGTSGH